MRVTWPQTLPGAPPEARPTRDDSGDGSGPTGWSARMARCSKPSTTSSPCSTSRPSRSTSSGASAPTSRRQRVFGGQVAGQALVAAARTVDADRRVHSLHAYFLRPGRPDGADPLRGRPHPRRPLVHHPPGRRHPARQGHLQPAGVVPRPRGRASTTRRRCRATSPAPETLPDFKERWAPWAETLGDWLRRATARSTPATSTGPRPTAREPLPPHQRVWLRADGGPARRPGAARLRPHLRVGHDPARHDAAAPRRGRGREGRHDG